MPQTQRSDIAVACNGLAKRFGAVHAVRDARFEVRRGEVFGLLGPDGAGKTTTMRMLCGILPPTGGDARVLGFDVARDPERVKERIGYVSQRFSLYGDLTVEENIEFFADMFQVPPEERPERTARLLAASRMEPFRKRQAQNLSGGMKQKLALACTLIHTPTLLLLDEPTTGVDPVSRRDFWEILYSLVAEGMTLLVSTPYMDEAERCHRLALMSGGRVLLCDTPANVRARMRGAVYAIESADPRAARAALRGLPGVQGVEAFGTALHAAVDRPEREAEMRRALEAAGARVSRLERVEPGLEDVFVSLLEAENADGARH